MTDKEIGELWHQANHVKTLPNNGFALTEWIDVAIILIRKLVEERRDLICTDDIAADLKPRSKKDAELQALKDFGINPEDFK